MGEDELIVCAECGAKFEEDDTICYGTEQYCVECHDDLFPPCSDCGRAIPKDELTAVAGEDYCESCLDDKFYLCSDCEEYYPCDEGATLDDGNYICQSCFEHSYFCCNSCERVVHNDYYAGEGYCDDCHAEEREHQYIQKYHEGNSIKFYPDDEQDLYLGIELETDNYKGDIDECSEALATAYEGKLWLEEDGSLSDGFEIISQPCTLDYHQHSFPWQEVTNIVRDCGGRSHQTSTCGLHIHFNISYFGETEIEQDMNSLKLVYIFERFWDELVILSRRKEHQLNASARRYAENVSEMTSEQYVEFKQNKGRSYAVNLNSDSEHTLEIRIFRGTLKLSTLLASIELVDFLARFCRATTIANLQSITWTGLINAIRGKEYTNLRAYIIEKGLGQDVQLPLPVEEETSICA